MCRPVQLSETQGWSCTPPSGSTQRMMIAWSKSLNKHAQQMQCGWTELERMVENAQPGPLTWLRNEWHVCHFRPRGRVKTGGEIIRWNGITGRLHGWEEHSTHCLAECFTSHVYHRLPMLAGLDSLLWVERELGDGGGGRWGTEPLPVHHSALCWLLTNI